MNFKTLKKPSDLGKDTLITLGTQLVILLLGLVVNKWLSVSLGVEGFGQYSLIKKSTQVLSFVMLSGMGIALPRYFAMKVAKYDWGGAKATVYASMLVVGTISTMVLLICMLFGRSLSVVVSGGANRDLYLAALVYAFSMTSSSFLFAYFRGANAFMKFGISQIIVQVLVTVTALMFGGDLKLLLYSWSVATLGFVLMMMLVERSKNALFKKKTTPLMPQFITVLGYGMPRLLGDFFLFSFAAFPLVYLNEKMGIRASSFFAVGLTLTSMVSPLFSYLGMVLLPYVSTATAQNNFAHADSLVKKLTGVYLVLSVAVVLVVGLGMSFFIPLFFSAEFLPALLVSRILLLSIVFESIYLLLRNPIDAVSTFPYNTVNLMISLGVLVVLFSLAHSAVAFAWAFFAATVLKSVLSFGAWQMCRIKMKTTSNDAR